MDEARSVTFGRRALPVIRERMHDEPVILLEGPRSVGKSTLLRRIADASGSSVVDLDDLATRDAVSADPALFIAGSAPIDGPFESHHDLPFGPRGDRGPGRSPH